MRRRGDRAHRAPGISTPAIMGEVNRSVSAPTSNAGCTCPTGTPRRTCARSSHATVSLRGRDVCGASSARAV